MNERELRDYLPFVCVRDGAVLSRRGDITFGWKLILPAAFSVDEPGYDSIIQSARQAFQLLPPYCIVHKQDIYRIDSYQAKPQEHFLAQAREKYFEGRRFLNGYCNLYLTFSNKSNIEGKNSASGFFGISDMKAPSQRKIEDAASIASQFEAVLKNNSLLGVERMASDDFISAGPDGRDKGTIADFLGLFSIDGPDYNFEFRPDRINYGDQVLKVWYVEDSDAYGSAEVSSVTPVQGMSSGVSKIFLSGGSPIGYRLKIPHVINRYILTLPRKTVENELDSRRKVMNAFSLYSAASAVNSQELSEYLLASAKSNTTTVKCHMNIMAWCSVEQIPDVRNKIITAFHSDLQVGVVEERRVVPLYHYAAIPGAEAELGYDNYLTSEIMGFLCHGLWDGYDYGIKGGVVHVSDRERMIPMCIDIQSLARSRQLINNMNAIVIGPSGSGKSFTMNSLVQDFYDAGEHTLIIDVGDSYEIQCRIVNEESGGKDGVYNTYDPEHPFGFNPFKGYHKWNEKDEDGEMSSSGYDFILSLMKTIYKPKEGWNNESSSILKFILNTFLEWWDAGVPESVVEDLRDSFVNEKRQRAEKNHKAFDEKKALSGYHDATAEIFSDVRLSREPVFDDFYQYVARVVNPLMRDENFRMGDIPVTLKLLDVERFAAAMDMYKKDGVYGFLLNNENESDLFASRFTVFEVDRIKDNADLFPLWVLCIMHSFEDKMRALSCPKVIVIEEAWKAIATETMAEFIVWMWRTARKFRTSAVVVTQDINDLVGSDIIKGAIIQNSDVKILLDQRKNAKKFDDAVKLLGLSDMARNLILSVNTNLNPAYIKTGYKEGFFGIGESYGNVFSMEVSPEQAVAFETDKTIKADWIRRANECGSMIKVVKEEAERRKRKLMINK